MASTGIDFVLRLKDMLGGPLQKVERDARGAFGRMDAAAGKAKKSIGDLGGEAKKAKTEVGDLGDHGAKRMNELARSAERAAASVSKVTRAAQGGSGSGGGFWRTAGAMGVGSLLAGAASTVGGFAINQTRNVLNSGMEAGRNRVQFNVMAGDMGPKLYSDLSKYIKDSIFGTEQYDLAKTQLSYGVNAKDVLSNLKMLGDISGGDVEKLKALNYAFAQTTSVGKLQGDDLRQYTAAGFNPLAVLSQHTGKSMAQLRKEQEAGLISAGMVRQAMVWDTTGSGLHAGMLDRISNTPFGKADMMRGNVSMALQQMGEKLMPAFARVLDRMMPIVDKLPDFLDKLVPYGEKLADAFGSMIPGLMELGSSIGKALKPVLDLAAGPEMKEFRNSLLELASTIVKDLTPVIKGLARVGGPIARLAGVGVTAITKDADFMGASAKVTEYYKNLPSWGQGVKGDWDMPGDKQAKLFDQIMHQYGGLQPWMNDKKEMISWMNTGKFTKAPGNPYGYNNMFSIGLGGITQNDKLLPFLGMGGASAQAAASGKAPVATAEAQRVSDSIVGGGRKVVNFNIHNLVETINNNPAGKGEALTMTERDLEGVMVRLAATAAGM